MEEVFVIYAYTRWHMVWCWMYLDVHCQPVYITEAHQYEKYDEAKQALCDWMCDEKGDVKGRIEKIFVKK